MRLSAIPGHARTLRNGHQFVATVRRIGLGRQKARSLGKTLQVVRSPREYLLRRRMARRLLSETRPPFSIEDGFVRFTASDLPFGPEALAICQEIADDEKAAYDSASIGKGFLRTLLSADTLTQHPDIMNFATSTEINAVVTEYLGEIPMLADVRLWWSVPSTEPQTPAHSQKFHRDHEDFKQIKVFLNVEEVTTNRGPFTLLPAQLSQEIADKVASEDGRYDDSAIFEFADPSDLIVLTGPPGDGAMIDTCRCFHYGSRNEKEERLVLVLHYVSYNSIFEPDVKVLTGELRQRWQSREPEVAALMRIRPAGL